MLRATSIKPITTLKSSLLANRTSQDQALQEGQVVASYGKRYGVELKDGRQISCVTRGKKMI